MCSVIENAMYINCLLKNHRGFESRVPPLMSGQHQWLGVKILNFGVVGSIP